jgi:hypothetical protein
VLAETVAVHLVLDQMLHANNGLNIVILDACRNNPFERRVRGKAGGLAFMDAPKGTLLAYATAPGSVALDGYRSGHSPYTEELLKVLPLPGLRLEDVFKRVRVAVDRQTGGAQLPWESSSLVGDFYFVAPEAPPGLTTPAYGKAIIDTASADVAVFLNGSAQGHGPVVHLELPAGRYQLLLKEHGLTQRLDLIVEAGHTTRLVAPSLAPKVVDRPREGRRSTSRIPPQGARMVPPP